MYKRSTNTEKEIGIYLVVNNFYKLMAEKTQNTKKIFFLFYTHYPILGTQMLLSMLSNLTITQSKHFYTHYRSTGPFDISLSDIQKHCLDNQQANHVRLFTSSSPIGNKFDTENPTLLHTYILH